MKKVLIVDDDAWLADSYGLVLRSHGWQVTVAGDAAHAIDLIDDIRPDVVLLDYLMPSSSAPALLHELQSHSDMAALPVVLCSSLGLGEHRLEDLRHYGVRQVIDKSTATPELIVGALADALHAAAQN